MTSKGRILINFITFGRFPVVIYYLRGDVIGYVEVHDQDQICLHGSYLPPCHVEVDMILTVNLQVTGDVFKDK